MINIVKTIQNATDEGCTDIEAIELATDLMKIESIKQSFPSMNNDEAEEILSSVSNSNEVEINTFTKLSNLSKRERECYLLHHVGLMPFQAIANKLGVSKGSVNTYIRRAREKLNNYQ